MSDIAPWERTDYSFTGPGVAVSCEVDWDREQERYVAKGEGWVGFSRTSAKAAALNCFRGWLLDEGAHFEPEETSDP